MEGGVARNITDQTQPVKKPLVIPHHHMVPSNKVSLVSPMKQKKKKFRDKLLRPKTMCVVNVEQDLCPPVT